MQSDSESFVRSGITGQENDQTITPDGLRSYSKTSKKESNRSQGPQSGEKAEKKRQDGTRTSVCNERLYSKHEVSLIVRDRVKRLNERIAELELENAILRSQKEEPRATDE